jgi:hypothetical protein
MPAKQDRQEASTPLSCVLFNIFTLDATVAVVRIDDAPTTRGHGTFPPATLSIRANELNAAFAGHAGSSAR